MEVRDSIDAFLMCERDIFSPKQFLRVIKNAMDSNSEYSASFNMYKIELINKKIRITDGYSDFEAFFDFSEFESRVLKSYKKMPNPQDDGIFYDKIEIPNFENQLNDLLETITEKLENISDFRIEYNYNRSVNHEHDTKFPKSLVGFASDFRPEGVRKTRSTRDKRSSSFYAITKCSRVLRMIQTMFLLFKNLTNSLLVQP